MSKMQDGGPRKRGVPSPSDQRRKTGITEPSGSLPNSFRSRVLACAPCFVRSFSGPLSLSLSKRTIARVCTLVSFSFCLSCYHLVLSLSLSHSFICALISLPRTPSFQRAFSPLSTRAARGSSGRRWRPGMPCGRRRGRGRGGWRWRWRRRFFWTTTRTGAA